MENRRPTSAPKPFNPRRYFDKNKPNTSTGYAKYNPGTNDNRTPSRDNNERFQNNNERFQNRDTRGKYQPRDGSNFQPNRDGRVNRDGRNFRDNENFRNPRGGSPNGPGKYISRSNNKFNPKTRSPLKGKSEKPWLKENNIKIVSDLQVTDGKHKGKYLQNSASTKMRPTSRRLRDIMFKILFRRVRAGRFLDLCAGAGTMGIEAISRGALISTFVERSSKMCSFIKKNLESLGIKEGHGEICEMEAVPFLKKMAKRRRQWDVIYLDPPSDTDYEDILSYLKRGAAIKPAGVLVIEHPAEMFFPENFGVLKRWRVVVQDDSALSFYERK